MTFPNTKCEHGDIKVFCGLCNNPRIAKVLLGRPPQDPSGQGDPMTLPTWTRLAEIARECDLWGMSFNSGKFVAMLEAEAAKERAEAAKEGRPEEPKP